MKKSTIVATSRDVQEVVSKLSSDKARTREEGIKLLSTWLEGEMSFSFCKLLGRKTASLKREDIPHSETWPFLLKLLMKCITLEISSSKKRPPKLLLAKMLRTIVQRAEDVKFSGNRLMLLSVVKLLFNHILDVVRDSTVYQSEYNIILRHLLSVREYCCQMRKRIYCSLVLIYMKNVGLAMDKKGQFLSNVKEDVFRNVLTLHVLLENSPGDFPDNLREDVVKGFIGIFSKMSEEGKISRKLMECINTYLLKDGPNIGSQAMDIHRSLQDFVFHCWLTTHDKGLKNCLINYAKLQLKLNKISEGGTLIEQLLDVVDKELNQNIIGTIGIPKCDTVRDDKACTLGSLHLGLMELAASVYYQACSRKVRASNELKRLRREDPSNILKDGITEGKWLWCGSFYFLLHYYGSKIDVAHLSNWFEGISGSFERILTYSNSAHCYDGIIWLLRGLTVLLSVIPKINLDESQGSSFIPDKARGGWLVIWNSLMHALPVFSNVSQVVDAAMTFLGSMISKEIINLPIIPRDVWELPIFKDMPSPSALYFLSCYFSRRGIQSDLDDAFVLRKNLLKAALGWLVTSKDTFVFNEQVCTLLPAAITSLSSGSCPFSYNDLPLVVDVIDHTSMEGEYYKDCVLGISDYSLEVLAEVGNRNSSKVIIKDACLPCQSVRLPQEMRKLLISEIEEILLQNLSAFEEAEKLDLPDMILLCSFSCNCLSGLNTVWLGEEQPFISQMLQHISKLLCRVISFVEGRRDKLRTSVVFGTNTLFEATSFTMSSFRSLMKCPLFSISENLSFIERELPLIKCLEKLLSAFMSLFKDVSYHKSSLDSVDDIHLQIVDIELDTDGGSNDTDGFTLSDSRSLPTLSFSTRWKFDMVNTISLFFSVIPVITWECLFDIYQDESDSKVQENIISHLCNSFSGDSSNILKLVNSIENMIEKGSSCVQLFTSVKYLLGNLVSVSDGKDHNSKETEEIVFRQILQHVADLVVKLADLGLPDWCARIKLIDCICHFVVLDPCIGQAMIARFLPMLRDSDYRVRLILARQIGVLFQRWDGHDEIFQDVCSNLGFELVTTSKERIVKAHEVLASSRSELFIETAIIALAHIALYSEKLEFEIIFMICAVAATEPSQRDLIHAILNNFSAFLKYSSRTKFLAELMGPILYRWVICEVSLMSLVEIRELFLDSADPKLFLSFCCTWLLPSLIIHEDFENLNLVSRITAQPLSCLVRSHFVQIFSFCIALHSQNCCENSTKSIGKVALHSSLMRFAEISKHERDNLIKRHLVSIVSHLLSLSSASCFPVMPLFTQEALGVSLRIVVDGFLEEESNSSCGALVDKLNLFRGDRVFKFLLETHYQITRAVHPRHRCHRLSSIQVLLDVIGRRAILPSTSCYIFNLVGQFIGDYALQDQCCIILSTFLTTFKSNLTNDAVVVLGKQLQCLVSKLVACYLPCRDNEGTSQPPSSRVLDLLHQLTVYADPSLHKFIKELEPFPELDCFKKIQNFLDEIIILPYSPREHFLQLVKRSCSLSRKSLLWSLQLIHKKLVLWNSDEAGGIVIKTPLEVNAWEHDPKLVSAVWNLAEMCNNEKVTDSIQLVADLIARVGLGDPYSVVFRLPAESNQKHYGRFAGDSISNETLVLSHHGLSEEDMINLLRLLKKCVNDDCVTIVDVASRALQGILSTERGQTALRHFDEYERSLIAVHSKGVDHNRVEVLINDSKEKHTAINRNDFTVWRTHAKTYKMWICPLVHSLLSYSNDIILLLCHDVVLQTDEIAEFLFPILLLNIAVTNELDGDICHLISEKVQKYILVEANNLIKSVQVILHVLNKLRSYYVIEKSSLPSTPHKHGRVSSSPRVRYALEKSKDHTWKKVYWLSIDYLLVAKAALCCGSFFTAVMYVEHWCEEHFNRLTLGNPNYSNLDLLEPHIELLIGAVTQINEPDSIYGIIQTHKLSSQIVTYEHEEKWSKALEYYDLLVRTSEMRYWHGSSGNTTSCYSLTEAKEIETWKSNKGLMRSLQQIGCMHVLNVYCKGLGAHKDRFQEDPEFSELQYEAAWRAGNWDFSLIPLENNPSDCCQYFKNIHFNKNLHSCLRAFQEGDCDEFSSKIKDLKKDLMLSVSNVSHESTRYIHSTIVKIQTLDHLSVAWGLRWPSYSYKKQSLGTKFKKYPEPTLPSMVQMRQLNKDWSLILRQMQLNLNLLEPFIAFRNILLGILNCKECRIQHLLQSASVLRKGMRFSPAVAALHEFKILCSETDLLETSYLCSLGRIEEARVLWGQGQHELAINLAKYILTNCQLEGEASNVYRLVGKWFAETHSSNSRTILEQYLKRSVELTELNKTSDKKCLSRQCQTYFNLAHYSDSLFKSYEERLLSSEWQAAMRLRRHKAKELDALIKRLKGSTKGEKNDYSVKILELQKQLSMDKEEAKKIQDDRDNFLSLALEGYQRCLVISSKYDIRVVFRLVSLWFSLSSRKGVIRSMLTTVEAVQSYKFIPLVYQIASRMGSSSKDVNGSLSFQAVLVSLVKKMAIDHPYHTIYQLLALANGDRVKNKQRSRNSFIVDLDKKQAAENLLNELSTYHGPILRQMKQMVEAYIKLAELETKKEETNKRMPLPREIRSLKELELVPVVTASFPVDPSCEYKEGSFPHFKGLVDPIIVMNGINAPKVVECVGSDGHKYRQLAKSGNDDLRQDAVMEQFFGLVNTFLQSHRDTWKRKIRIRTYKVVPFTPSAGVLEWVDGTIPLGEYLLGSTRNGGAHGRYGIGDWSFLQCREHMASDKDKRKAFQKVCENFRPVMHNFFLERFLQPADWFEKRLSYTRSVAASSMVGYIVGLGDRHSMNILIDQATAEVVHIDLGVAFEQGLMLKTPERVPFRLTRDMIDGMGVTGVEGVFRRCCEETLSVMRANKEALLTIVEVFIHDPLYKWALSPLKALQRQKETYNIDTSLENSQDAYEGNKDATRALLRVKQKLDGYEDGEIRSVQGQVQQLIQDAIDTERLCEMFPGWGAWL